MSDSFRPLEQLLKFTTERHNVISSNIANVDTPNYRAKDVSFGQVLGTEISLANTNSKHLQAAEGSASGTIKGEETQPWADNNNVEMDTEVAKMTENALLYQAGANMLMKKIQMYKSALRTS